jgi:hypothetical protein
VRESNYTHKEISQGFKTTTFLTFQMNVAATYAAAAYIAVAYRTLDKDDQGLISKRTGGGEAYSRFISLQSRCAGILQNNARRHATGRGREPGHTEHHALVVVTGGAPAAGG